MRKHLAAVGFFSALAITGVMTLTLTSDNTTPEKGKGLQLSCLTSGEFTTGTLNWFPPPPKDRLSVCFSSVKQCSGNTSSYSFTADSNGAYAYINSLSRENDSGIWKCASDLNESANIEIKVYTIPSGLSITQNPNQDVDLSVNSIEMQCITVGCTYPKPTVQWIFKDQTTSSETEYATVSPTERQETCTSLEMVYTGTLQIPRYTTFSDNSDKTGTFYCRIEYPDTTKNINSSLSKNIRFEVHVRNITLDPSGDRITFLDGTNASLRCTAGPSRPQPVITWWLDSTNVTNLSSTKTTSASSLFSASSELNLIVVKTYQGKKVYCDAKVTGQVNAIESKKPTINVWYQPSIPSVQTVQGDFPWLENQTGTLQCVMADLGNPTASVKWTSSRGTMDMDGNLVFRNLSAIDHGQLVYCHVQNNFTDIKGLTVLSPTISLNVEYRPTITLNPSAQTLRIKEGSNLTVTCLASGNPLPMVQWKNRNPSSTTLFIPNILRSNTGSYTCVASSTSTNYNRVVLQREESTTVIVEYAPDVIVNITGSMFVGSNAVLMCTAQGEPPHYTFHPWIHRVGQTEIRRLNGVNTDSVSMLTLSIISIQDMGLYICTVNNTITGLDGQLYQTGDTSLYVQGPPVIGETGSIFAGEIGKSANIEIPFYSSSSTTVKFIKHFDSFVISNTSNVSIYIFPSIITLTFYTEKVMMPEHVAVLFFRNVTDKDFVHYKIQLSNEKGNVTMGFDFLAKDSMYAPSVSDSAQVGLSVGGGVGVGVGCFVLGCIVSLIAFTIRRQLNVSKNSCFSRKGKTDDVTYSNTEMTSQPIKPIYEELNKGTVEHNMYDKIEHSVDGT